MGEVPDKRCPEVEARFGVVVDKTERRGSSLFVLPTGEVEDKVVDAENNISALKLQDFADARGGFVSKPNKDKHPVKMGATSGRPVVRLQGEPGNFGPGEGRSTLDVGIRERIFHGCEVIPHNNAGSWVCLVA